MEFVRGQTNAQYFARRSYSQFRLVVAAESRQDQAPLMEREDIHFSTSAW